MAPGSCSQQCVAEAGCSRRWSLQATPPGSGAVARQRFTAVRWQCVAQATFAAGVDLWMSSTATACRQQQGLQL
jgi:hypothetical protein